MKNYYKFINENIDDLESQFLILCHINELEIRFNFFETKSTSWTEALIYAYNNDIIFYNPSNKESKRLFINELYYNKMYNGHGYVAFKEMIYKYFKLTSTRSLSNSWMKDYKYNWI